ncbi:hypothetical protein F0365_04675 [Nonlabens sp. Ci31]|jgi:hypothetical protein|uniref:hypothetical protein n=1 Tax=Nonlabens sp. Ci31 TaxID=2608253 RepID=UPI0014636C0E|nr:hypothetical protein [Nonlabens sp. Ci31]QJP33748.1 hypothetical protein F0365_04675 [Nonlabens sp. Ci31]
MKNLILLFIITVSSSALSQINECSIQNIQLDPYDFVLRNLEKVNQHIKNKNYVIEVSIHFKDCEKEYKEHTENTEVSPIIYHLISLENSYRGENKTAVVVYKKLNQFVLQTINECIDDPIEFKNQAYVTLIFRIPLNVENIQKALKYIERKFIYLSTPSSDVLTWRAYLQNYQRTLEYV